MYLNVARFRRATALTALAIVSLGASVAFGANDYAALTGCSTANGSIMSPWDLQTALNKSFAPGDTLFLRGGTYKGTFTSHLKGNSTSPIHVKQYPGEAARSTDVTPITRPPSPSLELTHSLGISKLCPTSGMVYVNAEPESAAIAFPMTIVDDARARGGKYVSSTTANSGTATCTVNLSASATYVIWGRVLAPNSNQDSFFVSVDGGTEDIYDDAEDTWSTAFEWTEVNGRTVRVSH